MQDYERFPRKSGKTKIGRQRSQSKH